MYMDSNSYDYALSDPYIKSYVEKISGRYGNGYYRPQYPLAMAGAGWFGNISQQGLVNFLASKVDACLGIMSALGVVSKLADNGLNALTRTELLSLGSGGYEALKNIIEIIGPILKRNLLPPIRDALAAIQRAAEHGAADLDVAVRNIQAANGLPPIGAAAQAEQQGVAPLPPEGVRAAAAVQAEADQIVHDANVADAMPPKRRIQPPRKAKTQGRKKEIGAQKKTKSRIGKRELEGLTAKGYGYHDYLGYGLDDSDDDEYQYGHMWSTSGQPYTCNCDYNYYEYPPLYGNGFLGNVFKTIKSKAMPVLKQLF